MEYTLRRQSLLADTNTNTNTNTSSTHDHNTTATRQNLRKRKRRAAGYPSGHLAHAGHLAHGLIPIHAGVEFDENAEEDAEVSKSFTIVFDARGPGYVSVHRSPSIPLYCISAYLRKHGY